MLKKILIAFAILYPATSFAFLNSSPGTGSGQPFGDSTPIPYIGDTYIPNASHTICSINAFIKGAGGDPTDGVHMDIYSAVPGAASTTLTKLTSGSLIASSTTIISGISSTTWTTANFAFSPCFVVVGAQPYQITLHRTGSGGSPYYQLEYGTAGDEQLCGDSAYSHADGTKYMFPGCIGVHYYTVGSDSSEFFGAITPDVFAATSSASSCSRPSSIVDVGGGIVYAFCILFNPSQDVINKYANFNTSLQSKAPFAYLYSFQGAFAAGESADTGAFASVTIPFSTVDPATSTPFGHLLPDVTFLDKSTVGYYISPSILNLFRTMMQMTIWLSLAFMIYKRVLGAIKPA